MPQTRFAAEKFDSANFNLHATPETGASPRAVVVLVHGLGGKGYESWGGLPERMFSGEGDISVDVGIYDYRSGLRALGKRWDLEACVTELSGHVRRLEQDYADIFLVGHSLGGLLIERVAMRYEHSRALRDDVGEGALAAIVLVASPRAGTGFATPFLRQLIPEIGLLRRLDSRGADVDEFFATYVERANVAAAPRPIILPVYAAVGGADRLVSRFSAAFGVPATQRLHLNASHRGIVKPAPSDDQLVAWLREEVIAGRLEVRAQARRERRHSDERRATRAADVRPVVVTKFVTDTSGLEWAEIYNEALQAATTTTVAVRDVRDVAESDVDLLIAVHDAELIATDTESVRLAVLDARAERDQRPSMCVGFCPVGARFSIAEATINRWLAAYPPATSVYVNGAKDAAGLRGALARFLQLVIGRDPLRRLPAASSDEFVGPMNRIYRDWENGGRYL